MPHININRGHNTSGCDIGDANGAQVDANAATVRKPRQHGRITFVAAAIIVMAVGAIYVFGVMHYSSHFFPNAVVDGIAVGNMDATEASESTDASGWSVTINDIDGESETLDAEQAGLTTSGKSTSELISEQNPYAWVLNVSGAGSGTERTSSCDDSVLRASVDSLDMTDPSKRTCPTDALPRYSDGKFVVVPETQGTIVDADKLCTKIEESTDGVRPISVDITDDLLSKPSVTSDDASLNQSVSEASSWCASTITYDIDGIDSAVVVDSKTISEWIHISKDEDGNFSASLDEDAMRGWLAQIGDKYDTSGSNLSITTPDGKVSEVDGTSSYTGWITDEAGELPKLISDVKAGNATHREFTMKQKGNEKTGADVWGTTYIEIDLSSQQLWYVVDGQVSQSYGVITGKTGHETPTGVTQVYNKVTNTTLISPWKDASGEPTYKTFIEVGLTITSDGGVLIHSAPWQPSSGFGNPSYRPSGGSHGCCNIRTADCWSLYNAVPTGTPVVTHY